MFGWVLDPEKGLCGWSRGIEFVATTSLVFSLEVIPLLVITGESCC